MTSIARNDPCPCGSGKKYKQCCRRGGGPQRRQRTQRALWLAVAVAVITATVFLVAGREPAKVMGIVGCLGVAAYLVLGNPPPPKSGGNPGAINFGG